MFTFYPLLGGLSEGHASQSLLELDGGIKLLIDVGWDESFDVGKLAELEKHIPTLSLILLTHATVPHLAAYAHCCKSFPLFTRIPVYATRPVIDLGRTLTHDIYASSPAAATTIPQTALTESTYSYAQSATATSATDFLLQAPTPEEITKYFSLIQPLKYSQPHQPLSSPFSPPLNGLTITAYNAGHTLGGTIWHIQHGLESIVYAVDWNQARENVLSGAAWLSGSIGGGAEVIEQLRKPTALVCSSRGVDKSAVSGGRARRDEQMLDTIRACVARGGTVLIPTDSSARVVELAYFLEHAWRLDQNTEQGAQSLRSAKLYLAGSQMSTTMRYARSMLEWMDSSIVREFEAAEDGQRKANGTATGKKEAGPFDFRYLRLVERKTQIERVLSRGVASATSGSNGGSSNNSSGARVIIASDASMEWGFSKDLLKGLAQDPNNLVILTDKPGLSQDDRPSLARTLWQWWEEKNGEKNAVATSTGDTVMTEDGGGVEIVKGEGRGITIRNASRKALEGDELAVYQQWLAKQRQLHATVQGGGANLDASADAVDDASSESSSDSESDAASDTNKQQGKALNVSTTLGQAGRKKIVLRDEDLGVNVLIKKKGVYDFLIHGKKGRDRAFPITIRRKRTDDFGELIRQEEYLRAEERDDQDDDGGVKGPDEEGKLGRKRKWDEPSLANKAGDNTGSGFGKRQNHRGGGGMSDNADASQQPVNGSNQKTNGLDIKSEGNNNNDYNNSDDDDDDELDDTDIRLAADQQGASNGAPGNKPPASNPSGPCKLVVECETVTVNLGVAFVDYSGLHDRRSLNMLIPLIQPRKLIFVAGPHDETMALAADCRKLLGGGEQDTDTKHDDSKSGGAGVYTPETGTWVDASVDTNAWVVKLTDGLVKQLKWQAVRGLSIVTVTGQLIDTGSLTAGPSTSQTLTIADGDGSPSSKRQKTEEPSSTPEPSATTAAATTTALATRHKPASTSPAVAAPGVPAIPALDIVPTTGVVSAAAAALRLGAQPLHVGDLRLADLRRTMQAAGHSVVFGGEGMLVVDGAVAVRKGAAGKVEVESLAIGTGRRTFYEVRRMIYENLAVVAGTV